LDHHIQCLIVKVRTKSLDRYRERSRLRTCRRLKDSDLTLCDAVIDRFHQGILDFVWRVRMVEILFDEGHVSPNQYHNFKGMKLCI